MTRVSVADAGEPERSRKATRPRDRHERIRDRVLELGSVRIEDLARELRVSLMTVHRDLDRLVEQGWLRKVRGAATAEQSVLFESNVRYRMAAQESAKRALAQTAIRHVERGQAVLIDDSTTALTLARLLPSHGPLTVITNFLAAINELAREETIELIALGGAYYAPFDAFLGMTTSDAIRPLRADTLFMSTSAVTDGYCYHQSQEAILVKRALMAAARRRILLVDHTKFGKRALHQLAPLTDFDAVIVDVDTDQADLDMIHELSVTVEVAGRG